MKYSDKLLEDNWQIRCKSFKSAIAIQKLIHETTGHRINIDTFQDSNGTYFSRENGKFRNSYYSPSLSNKYQAKDFLTEKEEIYEIF